MASGGGGVGTFEMDAGVVVVGVVVTGVVSEHPVRLARVGCEVGTIGLIIS